MEKAEERMDRADARMDRLQKQLLATRDRIWSGVVYVNRLARGVPAFRESVREMKDSVSELARARRHSCPRIDRGADLTLRRHGNGRHHSGR